MWACSVPDPKKCLLPRCAYLISVISLAGLSSNAEHKLGAIEIKQTPTNL